MQRLENRSDVWMFVGFASKWWNLCVTLRVRMGWLDGVASWLSFLTFLFIFDAILIVWMFLN